MERRNARTRERRRSIHWKWFLFGFSLVCIGALLGVRGFRTERHSDQAAARVAKRATASDVDAVESPSDGASVLSGEVTARDGSPVADATVCAVCSRCEPIGARPADCTATDSRGRYALETAPGDYLVTASAAGFVPGVAPGGPAALRAGDSRAGLDIVLDRGGARVDGVVLDAAGGPVAHARVRAVRLLPPRLSLDVESDAAGRFAFDFAEGPAALSADAAGYARVQTAIRAPATGVELVVTPGARISGVVVSRSAGEPVPGLEVRAVPVENPGIQLFRSGRSDGEGRFEIDGMEPGAYRVVASGEGARGESDAPVEVGLAASVEDVKVIVDAAVTVSGQVVRASGTPCERGFVSLGLPDPTEPRAEELEPAKSAVAPVQLVARIEAGGAVRFPGVPHGRFYVGVHCEKGIQREGPRYVDVADRSIDGLRFVVGESGTLVVRAEDELGHPVPSTSFFITMPPRSSSEPGALLPGRTDETGSFEYPGVLRPGTYEVRAAPPASQDPVRVELPEGAGKVTATLALRGSASLTVDVRDERDAPVDGLQVSVVAAPAGASNVPVAAFVGSPLGQGKYRALPLPAGTYVVEVNDGVNPSVRDAGHRVGNGDTVVVRVALDRPAQIRGRVVDDEQGPVANVWVSAATESADAVPSTSRRALTDADGRFTIDRVAKGAARYSVRAQQPYGATAVRGGVAPGEDVELVLPALGAFSGTVTDDRGEPLARFTVQATAEGGASERSVEGRNGAFTLTRVAAGRVHVVAVDPQGRHGETDVDVSPRKTLDGIHLRVAADAVAAGTELAPEAR